MNLKEFLLLSVLLLVDFPPHLYPFEMRGKKKFCLGLDQNVKVVFY